MRSLSGAVAAITGAGSGIGRALALDFAARGADLALCDRDEAALAETRAQITAARRVTLQQVDVSDRNDVAAFRASVERDFGRCSVLVNNAGVALYGKFEELSLDDLEWIVGVNFWGPVYGCREFLPLLRREPEANIVTISSIFGTIAPPLQSGYSASKFAVRGFSEALRHELARSSVRVTVVHPGGIKTRIAANARRGAFADDTAWKRNTVGFERSLVLAPETAAARIADAVLRDRPRLLIGRDAFILDAVARLWPARYLRVLAPLLDPKGKYARELQPVPERR